MDSQHGHATMNGHITLPSPAGEQLSEASLRDFIEAASISLHSVGADGTILWANQAELDLLGYSREEYIGHNITQFHADGPVIDDILYRLTKGETLRSYPARLLCKDGSIRHVAIDSSVRFENGEFVHTRCITRDVTAELAAAQKLRDAEKWYRELIDALPVAVYTTNASGHITDYNAEAARFAGRDVERGKDRWCVSQRLYRADGTILPHDECPMAVALKTGQPVRGVEAIAERPDGTRVYFMPYPTPLKDDAGTVVGGINVLVDITHRKQNEEARARLAAIVESSDDAVISKNLNGVIQSWNSGAQRIFGYTPDEAIGKPVTMLIPEGHDNEEPSILARIRRGERVEHYETIRQRKNGSVIDISLTVSPVFDERGRVIGASKIARDISDRKRAEAELRRANADLEQLAYSATHDLQEPIRNISVYAEVMNRRYGPTLDERGQESLAFIGDSAKHMNSLVKGLLAYLQSGGADNTLENVDPEAALADALANLGARIQETEASVTNEHLPGIQMRAGQMEQLFQNLIANALKYRRDDEAPRIHIGVERAGAEWKFSVKDNGIGIYPQYKDRIFGIFKRLHKNDDKYPGTGIGLAICQRIVERQGGRIWVESDGEGQGSTFYFTVPISGHR